MCMKTLLGISGVFLMTLSINCFGQSAKGTTTIYNSPSATGIENQYSMSKGTCFQSSNPKINHNLSSSEYNVLSLNEKIEYSLFYPESYHQICSFLKPLSSDYQNFIHAYLLIELGERRRSEKQRKVLTLNRNLTVKVLSECLFTTNFLGRLEKSVIQELNAYECIPGLIEIFKKNKDTELLTLCLLLMKNDKFEKLSESKIHVTLYADPAHFSIGRPYEYYQKTPKNEENINIVLSLAKQYYELKMKEKK